MFASRVRELRLARSLSQEQLARKCDVSVTTIARIEACRNAPQRLTADRLADALDVDVIELYIEPANA
jgi:transcriptional regulator with XRE-family HTH domain